MKVMHHQDKRRVSRVRSTGMVVAVVLLVAGLFWGSALMSEGEKAAVKIGRAVGLVADEATGELLEIHIPLIDKRRDDDMAVKTQVEKEMRISGTLGIYAQHDPSLLNADPSTSTISVLLGTVIGVGIHDITGPYILNPGSYPDCTPPADFYPGYIFAASISGFGVPPPTDTAYYYFNAGNTEPPGDIVAPTPTPWQIELDYDMWVNSKRVERTQTTTSGLGRDGQPVYAKEVRVADEWVAKDTGSYAGTFGGLSVADSGLALPSVSAAGLTIRQMHGTSGVDYAKWSLMWDGHNFDFSGRKWTGTNIDATGNGPLVTISCISTGAFNELHEIDVVAPTILNFSNFYLPDRNGDSLDNLRVSGGFVANNHYPSSLGWSTTP